MAPIATIPMTPAVINALGAWPESTYPAATEPAATRPTPPGPRPRPIRTCDNRALIYRPNPAAFGGQELDRIEPCHKPATVERWSRRGTDQAQAQRYCQAHADELDAYRHYLNQRVDNAYAARGEEPLAFHIGDRVITPDGPGTVTFLPSAAWSDTYAVGLDARRRGDRPGQYYPDQLTAA